MIFVTVGTHEQQFDRLLRKVDELVETGAITEEVIIQSGFSTYEPKKCKFKKLFPYNEMIEKVTDARIVICHGGPATFIMPLQMGKIPVVVPRLKKFSEHINNHQLEFGEIVRNRQGNIILIDDMSKLKEVIVNYDNIVNLMPKDVISNNGKFNEEIERIVKEII